MSPFDISFYKNKKLDQNDIINVLNNLWKPDVQFNFPSKTYICGKEKKEKNLKFQYSWLVRYSWLAYSAVENGAFCKFCVAFSKNEGGTNSQLLGSLVLKKFDNWKHEKIQKTATVRDVCPPDTWRLLILYTSLQAPRMTYSGFQMGLL